MSNSDLIDRLNGYLADLGLLHVKLHNLHWNVEGANFFSLHSKLEELYTGVAEDLDEVAERVLMLGNRPLASLKDFLTHAKIKELPSEPVQWKVVLDHLEADFRYLLDESKKIVEVAEDTKDYGTADLFTPYIGKYEKTLWMFKAVKA